MCTLPAAVKYLVVRPDCDGDGLQVLGTCDGGLRPLRGASDATQRPGFALGKPVRVYQPSATGDGPPQPFEAEIITPVWDCWSNSVYFRSGCAVYRLVGDEVTLVAGSAGVEAAGGVPCHRASRRLAAAAPSSPAPPTLVASRWSSCSSSRLLLRRRRPSRAAIRSSQGPGVQGLPAGWFTAAKNFSSGCRCRCRQTTPRRALCRKSCWQAEWKWGGGVDEDGRGYPAGFWEFVGITADAAGFIYLLDKQQTEGRLRRVSPDGTITTLVTGLPCRWASPTILPNGYLALSSDAELILLDLGLQPWLPAPATAATAAAAAAAAAGPPQRSLPADLGALLDAQPDRTSDVTICVGERRFHVHRAILSARCDYFRQRLADDGFADARAAELELPDADADTFALLLRWLYTGAADIPSDQARGVAELADRLLFSELCSAALGVVAGSVTAGTVVDCLLWAAGCSESRGGGGGFGELVARLKEWYVSHHEEVAAEAGASRKRLAERAPGLSVEVTDALIARERDEARKRAKRAWR
ncbi:hypothetical protein HXX76_012993 [Chlamydomonas incerta]|uniref:BTB domain-containing protein n=1 Tax=Chlamydomonas incerta TaxID=51695 RepID=A0A835SGB7_CHLIN|nr:hypothetical protein HXX76_012993 [Chlamydomonas incerta]|eukprot:KAG2426683.1 hypothetical protein HXX76_012993 [Chlamydomonas incerta]